MGSLGQLVIELAANTARLQGDLGKAVGIVERTANRFKTAFRFAGGGLLGAAFVAAAKQAIDFGDSINKASIKAGIGNKAMSELAYAAKLADVDIASLSTAIKKMQVSFSEAGTGAKGPTQALAALGLTIQDVRKRKPEAQFELLADRISKLTDPADKARAAVELFGKAGADLLPLFEQGAAGIAKARAEAEKLGISFTDEQIKKLSGADESIKRLDASWKGLAATIAASVAGPLASFFDKLSGLDTRLLDEKIKELQEIRDSVTAFDRTFQSGRVAELDAKLSALKGRRELETIRALQTGTSGGPTSRGRNSVAIGFAAADAAAAAAESAKKSREADLKFQEKWAKDAAEINRDLNKQFGEDLDKALEEDRAAYIDYYLELDEIRKEDQKKLDEYRKAEAEKISEGAQVFKDAFLNAFDDMVNTGKFKWDELLKYMIAEFARRGIVKLFDKMFNGGGGGSSSAGWVAQTFDVFKNIFAGGRASGGNVQAGRLYEVGERGRELFAPGMSGSIIPNHAIGGTSPILNVTYNVDNRGATPDAMKMLPAILRANNQHLESQIVERLQRNHYNLG